MAYLANAFQYVGEDTEEIDHNIYQERKSAGVGNINPTGISLGWMIYNNTLICFSKMYIKCIAKLSDLQMTFKTLS